MKKTHKKHQVYKTQQGFVIFLPRMFCAFFALKKYWLYIVSCTVLYLNYSHNFCTRPCWAFFLWALVSMEACACPCGWPHWPPAQSPSCRSRCPWTPARHNNHYGKIDLKGVCREIEIVCTEWMPFMNSHKFFSLQRMEAVKLYHSILARVIGTGWHFCG